MQNNLSQNIDQLSVIARQCIAAVCFERYCKFHGLQDPDFNDFIEHLWRVAQLESPQQFVEWEQNFQILNATGWGKQLSETLIESLPPALRTEYPELAKSVIETSAATWYGKDIDGTKKHLIKVIEIVSKYGIPIPNMDIFKSSSLHKLDGWGSNPSTGELYLWRHIS